MQGYEIFYGDYKQMQNKYYSFANWFFVSPFLAILRTTAIQNEYNWLPYPMFGLVYGQSKAGKTSFLETLLKMMIGQKPKIAAPEFTRSAIEGLKRSVCGAPIIVDDLTQNRFNQHAVETIKNDDFGVAEGLTNYPAVVISANEDVKAVGSEITRRTVICRVQAGLKNSDLIKNNVVRRIQKQIGTAFYREYLRRMLANMPRYLNELQDETAAEAPDILYESSRLLIEILKETAGGIPSFVRELSLEDYLGERITGEQVMKIIQDEWKYKKDNFEINKKEHKLRYNAKEVYEANRMIKELPEDLEPGRSREWVVMNLEKAQEYFGIVFKKGLFR
jgi:GTPase SAR1 family protein